jgi:hypothetical protein
MWLLLALPFPILFVFSFALGLITRKHLRIHDEFWRCNDPDICIDLLRVRRSIPKLINIYYLLSVPSVVSLLFIPVIGKWIGPLCNAYLVILCYLRLKDIFHVLGIRRSLPRSIKESFTVIVWLELLLFLLTASLTILFFFQNASFWPT